MRAVRGLIWHMTGYAAPHVVSAVTLAAIGAATFRAGDEASSASEAVLLQLFISAVLLACSGLGYLTAIVFARERHAAARLPALFGTVAGAIVMGVAAVGGVKSIERWLGLSSFVAAALLGAIAGAGALLALTVTAGFFPKARRA